MGSFMLDEIEVYYDAVPRFAARTEDIGPFTLFVSEAPGWSYYARPRLGATVLTADDVMRVRERQRALAMPESFEWVAETTPGLRAAAEAAGLAVSEHPLMVLAGGEHEAVSAPAGVELHFATPDDDVARIGAVAAVAFGAPGTAAGPQGIERLADAAARRTAEQVAFERDRLRSERSIVVVARVAGVPVGVGTHQPVGAVSEVAGVGTLPAFRRRGIAAAVTRLLVADARRRGVRTVFLSAADDTVARLYARIGFRRVATACIAEPGPKEER